MISDKYLEYPEEVNLKLEKAYLAGETTVVWTEISDANTVITCTANLKTMVESDGKSERYKIQRKHVGGSGKPHILKLVSAWSSICLSQQ